jgi:hypothetical protein
MFREEYFWSGKELTQAEVRAEIAGSLPAA